MDANGTDGEGQTSVGRTSDRELRVTRYFDAPPRIVYQAWSQAELFMRWWAPKSMGVPIRACTMDVRTGGKYWLQYGHDAEHTFEFFGKYLDVVENERIVWTNDEGEEEGAITTVTFEESDGGTRLTYHELYPSKAALDEAMEGMESCLPEQFSQLDPLLARIPV